jgi:hypothetical protein
MSIAWHLWVMQSCLDRRTMRLCCGSLRSPNRHPRLGNQPLAPHPMESLNFELLIWSIAIYGFCALEQIVVVDSSPWEITKVKWIYGTWIAPPNVPPKSLSQSWLPPLECLHLAPTELLLWRVTTMHVYANGTYRSYLPLSLSSLLKQFCKLKFYSLTKYLI